MRNSGDVSFSVDVEKENMASAGIVLGLNRDFTKGMSYNLKEKVKFLEGITAQFDNSNFNCLLNYIDFPTDITEKIDFNYDLESKKVVESLKNHKFKDNVNVQRIIKKFEGNKE